MTNQNTRRSDITELIKEARQRSGVVDNYDGKNYLIRRLSDALERLSALPKPSEAIWNDMADAPKDGTMLRLLVRPSAAEEDGWTPFADSAEPYETIGFNSLEDTKEDLWQFAGWDWCHDCFTDGAGEVIGWQPFLAASRTPAQVEVTEERVERFGEMLRTWLPGHGWTGFGPHPDVIEDFLKSSLPALTAALTATDAKPLDDSSSCTKIWSIGNELHNIAIEHQTNEELAARLDKLACRLWEFRPATDAKPVVPAYPSKDELITSLLRQLQEARRCCTLCGASKWCEACQEVASLAPSPAVVICRALANFHSAPPLASEGKTDA